MKDGFSNLKLLENSNNTILIHYQGITTANLNNFSVMGSNPIISQGM